LKKKLVCLQCHIWKEIKYIYN